MLAGCGKKASDRVQGYAEGDYVYVSSPLAGTLESRSVKRGDSVRAGDPLYTLESLREQAARDEAMRRLVQGRAQLADASKGQRAPEIEALAQQLQQYRAMAVLSAKNFTRQQELFHTGATAAGDMDQARATRDEDAHRVAQAEASLQTAAMGSRVDAVSAAAANVHALEATLAKADWDLAQKKQAAPQAGLVFDTLYEPGEWVAAGRPVVALLPPENMKVRAFVPEGRIGQLQVGEAAKVTVDGVGAPLPGKISFISPQAEYTPPVIYSQESRGKLVFLVEVRFAPEVAATLHPGQPVDVTFSPGHE